jgi:F-type H+-transporting ATPase subunit alpha
MEAQVVSIYSCTPPEGRNSWVRQLELRDIQRYEKEMVEFILSSHGDILESIRDTGRLEEETEQKLKAALDEFAKVFQPSSRASSVSEST